MRSFSQHTHNVLCASSKTVALFSYIRHIFTHELDFVHPSWGGGEGSNINMILHYLITRTFRFFSNNSSKCKTFFDTSINLRKKSSVYYIAHSITLPPPCSTGRPAVGLNFSPCIQNKCLKCLILATTKKLN